MNAAKNPPSNAAAAPPRVAVVLRTTTGGVQRLAACLAALLGQRGIDPAHYEVVVVAEPVAPAADVDAARGVVHALAPCGGAPRVHYVEAECAHASRRDGADAAMRAAARVARAPSVVIVDDDGAAGSAALFDPDWLQRRLQQAGRAARTT